MLSRSLPFVAFVVLSALASTALAETAPPFDERALAPFLRPGTGAIDGKIVVRNRAGELRYRPGSKVVLTPVTPYSTFVHEALIGERRRPLIDPRLARYERIASADADGRFSFRELPAGEYYLICLPRWQVRDENATISASSCAHAKATVRERETTSVEVSR